MKGQFLTDRGKVRDLNEDAGGIFYNKNHQTLGVIADGMGGHQAGDVASELAVTNLKQAWENSEDLSTPEAMENWLASMIKELNQVIFEQSQAKEELKGMGATLVAACVGEDFVTIAHIGDSRCYVFNDDGFKQITEDHSLVNALVKTGEISQEAARVHPRKNIVLKALGAEENVTAELKSFSLEAGDKLLLASDGLTDKVSNKELANFLAKKEALTTVAEELVHLANERGGEDNISVIILQKEPPGKGGEK